MFVKHSSGDIKQTVEYKDRAQHADLEIKTWESFSDTGIYSRGMYVVT